MSVRKCAGLAVAVFGMSVVGCAPDYNDTWSVSPEEALSDGAVDGHIKEWEVGVELGEIPAGEVTFRIENSGTMMHEFLVVQTDVALGQIPVEGDRFSEELETLAMVDEIPEFDHGTTKELKVTLTPGSYQLVCNIAGHYQAGMYTSLTVV